MYLGIMVVYMVKPENEKILELHLHKIRTMTHVPYTIYAGVSHLPYRLRKRLENEPHLKILPLPETDLRMSAQHSFYLEQMLQTAICDEITHVAILHADSFPVRPDWAETIAGNLTENRVLATISRNRSLIQYTACLFFQKSFYMKYHPGFLLTEAKRSTRDYQHFGQVCGHHPLDSGVGFVYEAYCQGLSWISLERSNIGEDHGNFGSIYGDLIFHLEGAYRYRKISRLEELLRIQVFFRICFWVKERAKHIFPRSARDRVRPLVSPVLNSWERPFYDEVRRQLLDDPDNYLEYLRHGDKTSLSKS
jgi:hypothetical protein